MYLPAVVPARIANHIAVRPNGCWTWRRAHTGSSYGAVWWQGNQRPVHRVLYELLRAPVPRGLVLDHVVCEDKSCVNPWHLVPTTNIDNLLRERRRDAAAQTHCPHGHAAWAFKPSGKRYCSECSRIQSRKARQRRAAGQ